MTTYWISGGSGFLGTALTLKLLELGHKVRTFSRNEHSIEALQRRVPSEHLGRLSCHMGSVEDGARVTRSMKGSDFALHTAAVKIVPISEYDPWACLNTNVVGTHNVIEACIEAGVKAAAFVGTDKASAPATLYGASKLAAERLWLGANRYSPYGTRFVACRYGNVWGSKGSVLEAWSGLHAGFKQLKITDPKCTRFHITRTQAVELVLNALEHASPGDLWIPKLPTYRIGDLCMAFRRAFNVPGQPEITGLRMAEKLHEDLISPHESMACSGQDEEKYILTPGKVCEKGGWGYSSGTPVHQLGVDELTREVELWKGRS